MTRPKKTALMVMLADEAGRAKLAKLIVPKFMLAYHGARPPDDMPVPDDRASKVPVPDDFATKIALEVAIRRMATEE